MSSLKEVRHEISDAYYLEISEMPVDMMRSKVCDDYVPHILWKNWHGCRIAKEEGKIFVYHLFDKMVEVSFQGV